MASTMDDTPPQTEYTTADGDATNRRAIDSKDSDTAAKKNDEHTEKVMRTSMDNNVNEGDRDKREQTHKTPHPPTTANPCRHKGLTTLEEASPSEAQWYSTLTELFGGNEDTFEDEQNDDKKDDNKQRSDNTTTRGTNNK